MPRLDESRLTGSSFKRYQTSYPPLQPKKTGGSHNLSPAWSISRERRIAFAAAPARGPDRSHRWQSDRSAWGRARGSPPAAQPTEADHVAPLHGLGAGSAGSDISSSDDRREYNVVRYLLASLEEAAR